MFGREGRMNLDLVRENLRQLAEAGVPAVQLETAPVPCTRCGVADFHSYRRDGELAGRMVAAIAIR